MVTKASVEKWLQKNRPDLGVYEYQGTKGFYKREIGPAHSFHGIGKTWKAVLDHLKFSQV